jgi:hypothetical protein
MDIETVVNQPTSGEKTAEIHWRRGARRGSYECDVLQDVVRDKLKEGAHSKR